jgi:flavin reductase (NADH)
MTASYTATPAGFRSLMAGFPTGVAVITTFGPDREPRGMTCSSVCSVSVQPPTLLVCVRTDSPTLTGMLGSGEFTVNLLHHRARAVAELFASGDPDRFDRVEWVVSPVFGGPHLVRDAHAIADCRISRRQQVATHVVVFGEVMHVTLQPGGQPLMYGMRQYAAWPAG